jgi:hypothetical protein
MANDTTQGDESGDSREQGVEFGSLAEDLENEEYPISQGELLDRYGDRELDLQRGTTTVGEVLASENEREYEDAEGVRQAIFNMVGDEAVGREGYSDRGGNAPETNDSDSGDSI